MDMEDRRVLSSDRYVTSEAVLYKLMVRYLEDIGLKDIRLHFEDEIMVLKREKSKRIQQNLKIYKEIDQFFDEGCQFRGEESGVVVDLFKGLMINVMKLMHLPVEDILRFKFKIQKANNESLDSIKDVINYVHTLEFEEAYPLEGEEIKDFSAAQMRKKLATLKKMRKRENEEIAWDLEMRRAEMAERTAGKKGVGGNKRRRSP